MHKMRTGAAALPLLIYASALFASTPLDSLKILQSFDSPVPNPRAIVYDSPYFWISSRSSPALYKVDRDMRIVDSIAPGFGKVSGITFKDQELWVLRDSIAGDTLIVTWDSVTGKYDSIRDGISRIYEIDPETGGAKDSIRLGFYSSTDSSFLWGIVWYKTHFFISFNGGWGPCIFSIDPITGQTTYMCCPHPAGMKVINGEFWCVRNTAGNGLGRCLAILKTNESSSSAIMGISEQYRYDLAFNASDLAYDGFNLWLVDPDNSKICKMEGFMTRAVDRPGKKEHHQVSRISKFENGVIKFSAASDMNAASIELLNFHGVTIGTLDFSNKNYMVYDCSKIPSGVYFVRFISKGKRVVEKIIIQK